MCPLAGINSLGVLWIRDEYVEQQPEAGTRVGSTVLPSAGATPLVRGSGSGVKEETKPGEKKVSVIFPRLLQLLSTSVIPSKAKAALWMQAAPFTLGGTAHSPGSAVRAGNRRRSRAMVMWLLTRAQWSATSSDSCPNWGNSCHPSSHHLQRDMILALCSPFPPPYLLHNLHV